MWALPEGGTRLVGAQKMKMDKYICSEDGWLKGIVNLCISG